MNKIFIHPIEEFFDPNIIIETLVVVLPYYVVLKIAV